MHEPRKFRQFVAYLSATECFIDNEKIVSLVQERIFQFVLVEVKAIETVDILQILATDVSAGVAVSIRHNRSNVISTLHHLAHAGRQPLEDGLHSNNERVFITFTERPVGQHVLQEFSIAYLVYHILNARMLHEERPEPVGHIVEEREPLHL